MKKLLIPLLIIAVFGACSSRGKMIQTEFQFANNLAKQGLWKEAMYRWQKVLDQGKESATIYNNMAIALEKMGKFDEAQEKYKKALKIAPNNPTVKSNFNKLKKYLRNEDDEDDKKKGKKRDEYETRRRRY